MLACLLASTFVFFAFLLTHLDASASYPSYAFLASLLLPDISGVISPFAGEMVLVVIVDDWHAPME
jgi:hypothetical protein